MAPVRSGVTTAFHPLAGLQAFIRESACRAMLDISDLYSVHAIVTPRRR